LETYFATYSKAKKEVTLLTDETFPHEISWNKRIFNEISNFLDFVVPNTKPITTGGKVSQEFMILSSTNKIRFFSNSVFDLCCTGNYVEATALLRTILEEIQCIVFFYNYPEKIDDWLENKIIQRDILRLLDNKSLPLEINFRKVSRAYSLLSKHVHPSKFVLSDFLLINKEKPEISVKLVPTFVENDCQSTLFSLNSMLCGLLRILRIIFLETITAIGIEEDITRIINGYSNHYSRSK